MDWATAKAEFRERAGDLTEIVDETENAETAASPGDLVRLVVAASHDLELATVNLRLAAQIEHGARVE